MSKQLSGLNIVDIVERYSIYLEPVLEIAKRYGITRQGVYKILKRSGVDAAAAGRIDVTCYTCGEVITRTRNRVRKSKHLFCSEACYFAFLKAGRGGVYVGSRKGQRLARSAVSSYFTLEDGHVVHHEDRNSLNNNLDNLRVFATNGDHVRYHRGFEVSPIWDGRYPKRRTTRKVKQKPAFNFDPAARS